MDKKTKITLTCLLLLSIVKLHICENLEDVHNYLEYFVDETNIDFLNYDAEEERTVCDQDLDQLLEDYKNKKQWAVEMLDASAKLQSGIIKGQLNNLGHFDECMDIMNIPLQNHTISGKYCMADVIFNHVENETDANRQVSIPSADSFKTLKMGTCMPSSCEGPEVAIRMNKWIKRILRADVNVTINPKTCVLNEPYKLRIGDWFVVAFLILLLIAIIVSTYYDVYLSRTNQKPRNVIFVAFSWYSNGKRLFRVPEKKSNSQTIDCLNGMRFLSMMWIIMGHRYLMNITFPIYNTLIIKDWTQSMEGQLILGCSVTVDTFLVLSGILLAYSMFKSLDKTGSFNIIVLYIHRYIRVTPAYAAIILLHVTLLKYVGSGPLWQSTVDSVAGNCEKYWWTSLLYVQNYVNPNNICITQSWYLSVDMQMYWIAPIIIYPLWRKPKLIWIILALLIIACEGTIFGIVYAKRMPAGFLAGTGKQILERTEKYYVPTHTRATPWLMGLGLGYILHKRRDMKKVRINKFVSGVLWIASGATMLAVILGMYNLMQSDHKYDASDPIYLTFSRMAWALALCWIIFACTQGYGGIVNWFLSLSLWIPLCRLSYCIYLIHLCFQTLYGATTRINNYFSDFEMFYKFWGDFSISLILAIALTLTFESPMITIEKIIFGRKPRPPREEKAPTVVVLADNNREEKYFSRL